MQPNTKEFLAKKTVENETFSNPGISVAPTVPTSNSTAGLVYTAGPMAENGAKTKSSISPQMADLMNDGRGNPSLLNNGSDK